MQVSAHKVVSIHYTLTDNAGTVLDSSSGREPLIYIQGLGHLIPGYNWREIEFENCS